MTLSKYLTTRNRHLLVPISVVSSMIKENLFFLSNTPISDKAASTMTATVVYCPLPFPILMSCAIFESVATLLMRLINGSIKEHNYAQHCDFENIVNFLKFFCVVLIVSQLWLSFNGTYSLGVSIRPFMPSNMTHIVCHGYYADLAERLFFTFFQPMMPFNPILLKLLICMRTL